MVTVYEVDQDMLVKELATELKSMDIDKPEWSDIVKTGAFKERNPVNKDWWYARCASLLRKVYMMGPIGTQKLRRYYGGKKNRGHKPGKFFKGSGSVIRKAFHSLEKAQLIKKTDSPRKGRIISNKGQSFVDKTATKLYFSKAEKVE